MKNVTTKSIENLLEEAGFEFTVVDRCPDPSCEVCAEHQLSVAA